MLTTLKRLPLTKPCVDQDEAEAVQRVFDSGWLAEGPVTQAFERRVSNYVGSKYAVAVANCTIALELYLKVFAFKCSIIIPDFTHPATIQAILNTKNRPILHDVDLNTRNLASNSLDFNGSYVLPVSWGGNPVKFPPSLAEDAACSLGAEIDGVKVGAKNEACFSFHPRKIITTGEGGMVTTNDKDMANGIRSLKNFGDGGGNYKFDDVRAAIGLVQMGRLERLIARRISMAKIYDELLQSSRDIKTPEKQSGVRHTYQTYAVYLNKGNRDDVILKLREQGIETNRGAYALHLLPQYRHVAQIGSLRNSELLDRNLLALPMAYDLNEEDQERVVSSLKQALS